MLKFSVNLGVRNLEETNMIRWSSDTKPSVGGIPMYIVFLISICIYAVLPLSKEALVNRELFGLFSACSLGFLLGLADDAYNTNPLLKFIGQLTCANILISMEIYIELTPILFINYLITIIWVIGMMNSINMLDNMDGITGSISLGITISALIVGYMAYPNAHLFFFVLLGVLASLIGFMFFNWHPAKIYMGDTGSQFLGVFLAAIGIIFFWDWKEETGEFFQMKQIVAPLLVFILPIIDTTTVFIRRIARGQSPFVGGKDHTTHHLAFLGLKDQQVTLVFVALSLVSVLVVSWLFTVRQAGNWTYQHTYLAISYFLLLFLVMQILYDKAKKKIQAKEKAEELEKASKENG